MKRDDDESDEDEPYDDASDSDTSYDNSYEEESGPELYDDSPKKPKRGAKVMKRGNTISTTTTTSTTTTPTPTATPAPTATTTTTTKTTIVKPEITTVPSVSNVNVSSASKNEVPTSNFSAPISTEPMAPKTVLTTTNVATETATTPSLTTSVSVSVPVETPAPTPVDNTATANQFVMPSFLAEDQDIKPIDEFDSGDSTYLSSDLTMSPDSTFYHSFDGTCQPFNFWF
eukprot:TRINITY_DN1724_c0_g1_i7.p1 TRINITY_DN1724_c0_g1~~TRINITY_DN1724_c0_g1_i7.p1  ORF type:complete len:229 (-),score=54.29 TRINITY_DN1724_c0_g1_i7:1375-2061(-)